jgi:hypothetical protein
MKKNKQNHIANSQAEQDAESWFLFLKLDKS